MTLPISYVADACAAEAAARPAAASRAEAFTRLERSDALALYPDLAVHYVALDRLRRQIAWRSAAGQAALLALATASITERLNAGCVDRH